MGLIVSEVYDALVEAGASPDSAKAAAGAVPPAENMATKEDIARLEKDIARLEMATKQEFARLESKLATKEALAKLEGRVARIENTMATKDDIARLEKQIAVLSFAVFTGIPAMLAFMVKLTFFP
ncbi:MAG: hypothetical protein OXU42_12510 [Deltaproteobacteria bacterium]|nr:hypothetical protein [Deltaproteobacteria bacterium]